MGPEWTQDRPSWQQGAPKMSHDGATMALRAFAGSLEHFWSLFLVFWELGPPLEGPGGCLGRVLGAMLEDVGSKMVFFWISWEMLWHLGAKMAHRSAKTRQHSRT